MQKYLVVLLSALAFNASRASAKTPVDSIGVENLNGKKLVLHQVVKYDTYYSIGRRYQVTPNDVITYNNNKYLQPGIVIKVPTKAPYTDAQAKASVGSNSNTQGFIEHTVAKKENLNMLARKYGTTVAEIQRINELSGINLSIGQVLKMPVAGSETTASNTATTPSPAVTSPVVTPPAPVKNNEPVRNTNARPVPQPALPKRADTGENSYEELLEHTVASNETLYSIATRYNMTMDQLRAKNNMTGSSLRLGQKLLIRGTYGAKRRNNQTANLDTDTLTTLTNPALRGAPSRYGLNQIDEKGTAIAITDPDLDPTKMLVLHRTAPIGTVIKISNPMTNRSTFAKVVGKFTENESTKDAVIVMTKAVADALGVLDKRFFCNLSYSGQDYQDNNEQ